jgi:DNA polymerase I
VALAHLLSATQDQIDWPRALVQGRYMQAVSRIQQNGVPLDTQTLVKLLTERSAIQDQLIAGIGQAYGVYEWRTFKASRWEQ